VCADCHSNHVNADALRDASGRGVAPFDLWRGSMMAHAARDPIYRASVAAEQHEHPELAEAIGQKCTGCHAPAAWAETTLGGDPAPGPEVLLDSGGTGDLARDGATCVGCHLQTDDADGSASTWSGQLQYNDQREIYGPHRSPLAGPMRNHIQFTPVERPGMRDSATCVSCHMLQTQPLSLDGRPIQGSIPEQTPFVEYRSSDYLPERGQPEGQTCQGCHMPYTDVDGRPISTALARTPGGADFPWIAPRAPFARHVLVGGNAFALELIRDHRELLGSPASAELLDANIALTRSFLATAAEVEIGAATWEGDALTLPITVFNRTGHKLPTAYPSRRAWLHVVVRDATSNVVFESGGVDALGRLVGADGEPLASEAVDAALEPHRTVVAAAEDVVVWQSWMEDETGEPTTTLLHGLRYAKDNRLLPKGWAPSVDDAELVAPIGVDGDEDFVGGQDGVSLRITPGGTAPYTVEASVRYQVFSPRFLQALVQVNTPETRALGVLLEDRTYTAETLATATAVVSKD
jgi:hypothetical protein